MPGRGVRSTAPTDRGRATRGTPGTLVAGGSGGGRAGAGWTRFAPAPSGYLHLGHVANAIFVWGLAASNRSRVLLRIEDHDRERSRPDYDAAIVEDLGWLGFEPDAGPVRQADDPDPYRLAADRLRAAELVYACDCTRSTFASWAVANGGPWRGPGCPGRCRERGLPDEAWLTVRVALGDGVESWVDRILGPRSGAVATGGDLPIRARQGNWTYAFCVVVDDLRQDISLVVRGEDLTSATAAQIRLAGALGRAEPPVFAHHPLIRKPGGAKLSKADGDTGVRDLRAAGQRAGDVVGQAALAVGLLGEPRAINARDVGALFAFRASG